MPLARLFAAALLAAASTSAFAADPRTDAPGLSPETGSNLYSTGTLEALAARETTGPDTFALYGGPDHPGQGTFETVSGSPDFQGWVSVDHTETPIVWQVSTFAADNLNGNGPGNHAYWCGQDAAQQPDWVTAPGYGNDWDQILFWESPPVADPQGFETVSLDFFFNTDLEDGFDYLEVEYHFAGNWTDVYQGTGQQSNVQLASLDTFTVRPIRYEPNTYAGDNNDRIWLRIRVRTDGGWSDEDGIYPSNGAAQIDDISIDWSTGSAFEDFEGPGPWLFEPVKQRLAGDWASVLTLLTDADPCRSNVSPGVAFIDYGQAPINGPGADGTVSTGGSTSPKIDYGIPGHYIVNPRGGLTQFDETQRVLPVNNSVVSPEIPWNLPGAADDGEDMQGALLRFDVWNDLPDANLVGRTWQVRSRTYGGNWGAWLDRGFIYVGQPEWTTVNIPVGDLLVVDGIPDVVQVRLGVKDISEFHGFPGNTDATPAPVFDNFALLKHRIGGPSIAAREYELANDAFPRAPGFDVSTQAGRDALDVAFDQAQDRNFFDSVIVPADSLVIEVKALINGTSVTDIRMIWGLQKNTFFEDDIRTLPSRPQDENTAAGAQVWSGEVVALQSTNIYGTPVADTWYMDLPDVDLIYPGDVVHYYFQATDSDGRVTTLPTDTSGFLDFSEYSVYDREFMMRALPSVTAPDGTQPNLLVIHEDRAGSEIEHILALRELGETEGTGFDTYRVRAPDFGVSNGIGSAGGHGARVDQIAGYGDILYLSGSSFTSLSDGTENNSARMDKSDDLGLLTQWAQLPGTRQIAYFGDSIATSLTTTPTAQAYLGTQMGVQWIADDVRDALGGQSAPWVEPAQPTLFTEFIAAGGCPGIPDFDHIVPAGTGSTAWHFLDAGGSPIAGAAAAVMNDRANGFDVLFPIGFDRVQAGAARLLPSPRAQLLLELFDLVNDCVAQPCTDVPERTAPVILQVRPNPFNPSTTVRFTAAPGSSGSVKVYNLRGELVRTLHNGEFRRQEFTWDGTDRGGASVSSGVYVVRAETEGKQLNAKVALVK